MILRPQPEAPALRPHHLPDDDEVASPAQLDIAAAPGRVGAVPLTTRLVLLAAAVLLLALVPRLLSLDLFPTSDEDSWMRRTGGFTFGLMNGQLGRTYQNGHPGVTTMWLGMLSQGPDGAVRFADRVHGLRFVGQVPGYLEGLDHRFHAQGLRVVCVKPGFVRTSMTEGLPSPPFAGEPEGVARIVARAIERGTPVVYAPTIWGLVMAVIRVLPRFVMRRVGF